MRMYLALSNLKRVDMPPKKLKKDEYELSVLRLKTDYRMPACSESLVNTITRLGFREFHENFFNFIL